MAENILKLKKEAVKLGMSKQDAMKANRATLTDFISDSTKEGGKVATIAKKKGKKAAARTAAPAKKKAGRKPVRENTKTRRAPAAKKSAKAGKAKRPAQNTSNNNLGRLTIGQIDWSVESDDWAPRADSGTGLLFKALKRAKGNVDKAFAAIESDIFDFVGKTKRDGTKRTRAEAADMLRYRLNRTKFDFAKATGQHKSAAAKNRAVYGEGQYAQKKPKRSTVRKAGAGTKKTRNVKTQTRKTTSRKSGTARKSKSRK